MKKVSNHNAVKTFWKDIRVKIFPGVLDTFFHFHTPSVQPYKYRNTYIYSHLKKSFFQFTYDWSIKKIVPYIEGYVFILNDKGTFSFFHYSKDDNSKVSYDKKSSVPMSVSPTEFVEDITVGDSHAVLQTKEKKFYVAGDNTYGQLGLYGQDNYDPNKVSDWTRNNFSVENHELSFVKAIGDGTFLVLNNNNSHVIYAVGDNNSGQLGLLKTKAGSYAKFSPINIPELMGKHITVKDIISNRKKTAVWLFGKKDAVYTAGDGTFSFQKDKEANTLLENNKNYFIVNLMIAPNDKFFIILNDLSGDKKIVVATESDEIGKKINANPPIIYRGLSALTNYCINSLRLNNVYTVTRSFLKSKKAQAFDISVSPCCAFKSSSSMNNAEETLETEAHSLGLIIQNGTYLAPVLDLT